jgi:RNA polymerase sigma-70 factor (ECF subfamily)
LLLRALRIVRRRDLAEEVLQDLYAKVWESAHRYDAAIAQPMTWLISMLRHRAIDVLRSRHEDTFEPRVAIGDDADADAAFDESLDALAAADDDAAARRCDARRIRGLLRELHPKHRQSLALAYYHGLSHAEVASRMSAPLGSVKGWIHRGIDDMRRRMASGMA